MPEAQIDRFTFKINVHGVSSETLQQIITTRRHGQPPELNLALSGDALSQLFEKVDRIHLPLAVANYISRLVAATNPQDPSAPSEFQKYVRFGASPRAAIGLANTCRAAALLAGKPNAGFEEVQRVAPYVLGHRLILDYSAKLEGWTTQKWWSTCWRPFRRSIENCLLICKTPNPNLPFFYRARCSARYALVQKVICHVSPERAFSTPSLRHLLPLCVTLAVMLVGLCGNGFALQMGVDHPHSR